MPSTFARSVMLAAPSVAMAVVGAALFGPGAARSFEAAGVSGGPTEGMSWLSFRVAVGRRFRGIDSIVAGRSIEVSATSRGETAADRCVTGADGICDVQIILKKRTNGPIDLFVGAVGGNETVPLASGTVEGSLARWTERPPRGPEIVGSRGGNLELRLFALRGVLAAPFRDELLLSVKGSGGEPCARASVTMSLIGGDVAEGRRAPESTKASATTDEQGIARWTAVPRAHAVEVNVEARWQSAYGTFAGALPVVPGAIWLDDDHGKGLRIVSPVPRARAYAVFASRTERLWGGTIALENDENGFASGVINPWPEGVAPDPGVWLVLSGDPEATGVGTVGWPIVQGVEYGKPYAEQAFADALLLDGMPAAERRENDRRRHAAWLVAVALGATAGLEAALLLGSARPQGKGGGWGRAAAAVAAVVLAFAAIGIVAMWKAAG